MSMIFKFRMLSDENDHFVRDMEVPYDMTLRAFHEFLVRSLGYDDCMASFYTADERWERLQEYTLLDMGDSQSIPMERVMLGQLIHENRDRLIYLFDMLNNRALYLELVDRSRRNVRKPAWSIRAWRSNTLRHRISTIRRPTRTKARSSNR